MRTGFPAGLFIVMNISPQWPSGYDSETLLRVTGDHGLKNTAATSTSFYTQKFKYLNNM